MVRAAPGPTTNVNPAIDTRSEYRVSFLIVVVVEPSRLRPTACAGGKALDPCTGSGGTY